MDYSIDQWQFRDIFLGCLKLSLAVKDLGVGLSTCRSHYARDLYMILKRNNANETYKDISRIIYLFIVYLRHKYYRFSPLTCAS